MLLLIWILGIVLLILAALFATWLDSNISLLLYAAGTATLLFGLASTVVV